MAIQFLDSGHPLPGYTLHVVFARLLYISDVHSVSLQARSSCLTVCVVTGNVRRWPSSSWTVRDSGHPVSGLLNISISYTQYLIDGFYTNNKVTDIPEVQMIQS